MRFAIATADKFGGVFSAFLSGGWKAVKLFTFALNGFPRGEAVADSARRLGLPVQTTRLTEADLAGLAALGCEVLVVADYPWRIGDWRPHLAHAVNFHPSPLPEGRGPWPLARAVLEGRRRWGVSCHKLTPEFDAGDVLAGEDFDLDPDEGQDSLDLRCQMGMRRLAARVARDFPGLWERAVPQSGGSYWKGSSEAERTLDLAGGVQDARLLLRAFGSNDCRARVGGAVLDVHRAVAWHEPHPHAPGSLVHANGAVLVFALKDGYLALQEWGQHRQA